MFIIIIIIRLDEYVSASKHETGSSSSSIAAASCVIQPKSSL